MGVMTPPPIPPFGTMVRRGARKRCPVCGAPGLFDGWFTMVERCPGCNLRLEQGEGSFLGAMTINYGVVGVAFMAVLAAWLAITWPDVAVVPMLVTSFIGGSIMLAIFFPFSKSIWTAVNVAIHHPDDVDFGPAEPFLD